MYLLDTNVVSEFRKRGNANPGVRAFFASANPDELFLPVQVLGKIRAGIAITRDQGGSFCRIPGLKLLNPFSDPPAGAVAPA